MVPAVHIRVGSVLPSAPTTSSLPAGLEGGECVKGGLVFDDQHHFCRAYGSRLGLALQKGGHFSLSPERGGQGRANHLRAVNVETAPLPHCGYMTLSCVCI